MHPNIYATITNRNPLFKSQNIRSTVFSACDGVYNKIIQKFCI
jgi:hypothetical protein